MLMNVIQKHMIVTQMQHVSTTKVLINVIVTLATKEMVPTVKVNSSILKYSLLTI